jgi:hypothetical protein
MSSANDTEYTPIYGLIDFDKNGKSIISPINGLIDFDEKDAELETKRKFNRIQVLSWESCLLRTLGVYSRILEEIS